MERKMKNIKFAFPIVFLIVGVFFTFIASSMSESAGFTFRLFTAGPAFFMLGVATLIAPMNIADDVEKIDLMAIIKDTPKYKVAVWAIFFIAGISLKKEIFVFINNLFN